MHAGTPAATRSTGSKTIPDVLGRAAEQYGANVAAPHKVDGAWHDLTSAQVGERVREIALGLVDLPSSPASASASSPRRGSSGPAATSPSPATGAVAVPIYATNSPEECEWVAGDSQSVGAICESAGQVAKIAAVQDGE